jgi:hypothetical protein
MNNLLATGLDKFGTEIKIYYCSHDTISEKATSFFAKQWTELVEEGNVRRGYVPNIDGCFVIYLTIDDEVVGLRMWHMVQNVAKILLTAIDKKHRRKGLFKLITMHYDKIQVDNNCIKSITFIQLSNSGMVEAARQNGYKTVQLKMEKLYLK